MDETQSSQMVLSFISEHPDCKGSDIADHLHVSLSTVNRILAQLKAEGLVEYVGSKKTGGYQAVEKENL
ncbi:MAG: MarR family transcriptional regulator [Bacteroidales bacterium]|nr:MarR family transcriptional regulator [Bacteroidales bacterium]